MKFSLDKLENPIAPSANTIRTEFVGPAIIADYKLSHSGTLMTMHLGLNCVKTLCTGPHSLNRRRCYNFASQGYRHKVSETAQSLNDPDSVASISPCRSISMFEEKHIPMLQPSIRKGWLVKKDACDFDGCFVRKKDSISMMLGIS